MNPIRHSLLSHRHVRRVVPRRGHATLWVIVASPAMLAMLVLVSDVANLWLARTELQNAVEAAALAAADLWGASGDTAADRTAAHLRAEALAEANLVLGNTINIDANDNAGVANTNNAVCPADVMLGAYTAGSKTFDGSGTSPVPANQRGCRVAASIPVNSLWLGFAGPFNVRAEAFAVYETGTGTAQLVQFDSTDDPCLAP